MNSDPVEEADFVTGEDGLRYASRSGQKLATALDTFGLDAADRVCADLGAHVGGFVDCLLQHGAARVYAVEPGYGVLARRLREDERVVVCERTNALRWEAPEPISLITIDVGWTQQRLVLPVAKRALAAGGDVVTLVKPHYECEKRLLRGGVLPEAALEGVLATVRADLEELGWRVAGTVRSPLRGHGGNAEFLWWLQR